MRQPPPQPFVQNIPPTRQENRAVDTGAQAVTTSSARARPYDHGRNGVAAVKSRR